MPLLLHFDTGRIPIEVGSNKILDLGLLYNVKVLTQNC